LALPVLLCRLSALRGRREEEEGVGKCGGEVGWPLLLLIERLVQLMPAMPRTGM